MPWWHLNTIRLWQSIMMRASTRPENLTCSREPKRGRRFFLESWNKKDWFMYMIHWKTSFECIHLGHCWWCRLSKEHYDRTLSSNACRTLNAKVGNGLYEVA
jgi:hypothetical protein